MYTSHEISQLQACMQLQQAGRWPELAEVAAQLIKDYPQNADAWQLRGIALAQSGQAEAGLNCLEKALACAPKAAHIHNNLANLCAQLGRHAQAAAAYEAALALNPELPEAWHNLGNIYRNQQAWEKALGYYAEALKRWPARPEIRLAYGQMQEKLQHWQAARMSYQQVCRQAPQLWQAWFYLAHLEHQQGDLEAAEAFYRKTIELEPTQVDAVFWLAEIFLGRADYANAIACYERVLALKPENALAHNGLGQAWYRCNRMDKAEAHFLKAQALAPDFYQVINNLAGIRMAQRRYDEALAYVKQALDLAPDFVDAWENLGVISRERHDLEQVEQAYAEALRLRPRAGLKVRQALLLPAIYQSEAELQQWRARYLQNLQTLLHADLHLADPDAEVGELPFYLHYQGEPDIEPGIQLAQFFQKACPALHFTAPHCQAYQPPEGRLKIGFVSKHLRGHSIGKLMQGLIEQLDREHFEVCVYPLIAPDDTMGHEIMEGADLAKVLTPSLYAAREELAQEKLDILFYPDIGMESLSYFLAMARLAPLQVFTWGHGYTPGMDNLDGYFSSVSLETAFSRPLYRGQLIEMQNLLPYYKRPSFAGLSKTRADFGLPAEGALYICPQSLFKLHPAFDAILGEILSQDADAHLILLEGVHPRWVTLLRQRLQQSVPQVYERIVFLPRQNEQNFLELVALCDVNLDSWPLCGGNSTLDTLVTGTPLVTMTGKMIYHRLSAAIYQQLGYTGCIVETPQDYIAKALRFAHEPGFRAAARDAILAGLNRVYENTAAVREFEALLLEKFWQSVAGEA